MFKTLLQNTKSLVSRAWRDSGIQSRIAKGGMWLGIGSGSEHGLRLLRNMILARLLLPDAFGLMAIILAVNNFFESFTQIGIREAVIQSPHAHEKEFLNGAFFLAFFRGLFLFGIALAIVPLIAGFYEKPELIPMMRVSFVSIFFYGLISPKIYTDLKKMNYKKWVIVYHGGSAIGIITAITSSFFFQNVWVLVIGFTTENAARCLLSYVISPFFPTFRFQKESLYSLLRFAKGMLGIPILVFIYNRIDIFVLGKYVADTELGMYSLALNLSQVPLLFYNTIISPILLPAFSSMQQERKLIINGSLKASKYIALVFLPGLTFMACASPTILSLVYGERYVAAHKAFSLLCASVALTILGGVIVNVFFALGKPSHNRMASFIRFVFITVLIVPFVMKLGLEGAAIARLVSGAIWLGVLLISIRKSIGLSPTSFARSFVYGIVTSVVIGVGIFAIYRFSP